jgi:hypothetical protein
LCLGHTDEATDAKSGRLLGYVGFHEYDGYIEIMELRNKEKQVARKLGIDITCLRTGKGYHFISFTIMRRGHREKFAETMQKAFPSNYLQNAKHRVLRLGKKGSHMKPKFLSCYFRLPETRKGRYLSSSHMETYVNEGIIPKEVIEELIKHNGGNVRRTSETLCLYPAWIPKNMKSASLKKNERGEAALKPARLKKAPRSPLRRARFNTAK